MLSQQVRGTWRQRTKSNEYNINTWLGPTRQTGHSYRRGQATLSSILIASPWPKNGPFSAERKPTKRNAGTCTTAADRNHHNKSGTKTSNCHYLQRPWRGWMAFLRDWLEAGQQQQQQQYTNNNNNNKLQTNCGYLTLTGVHEKLKL